MNPTRQLVKAAITHEMMAGFDYSEGVARSIAEANYASYYIDGRLPSQVEMLDMACDG